MTVKCVNPVPTQRGRAGNTNQAPLAGCVYSTHVVLPLVRICLSERRNIWWYFRNSYHTKSLSPCIFLFM